MIGGMSGPGVRLPVRRIAAMAVDWLIISCYAAALVPLGLFLVNSSVDLSLAAWNAVSFVVLVVPAAGWLAGWESGTPAASPGKRLLRLRVAVPDRPRPGWPRSLARNALKVALPWELGHTAAFVLADTTIGQPWAGLAMACAAAACLLALSYVAALFVGTGRTPYDRAAGTRVTGV